MITKLKLFRNYDFSLKQFVMKYCELNGKLLKQLI